MILKKQIQLIFTITLLLSSTSLLPAADGWPTSGNNSARDKILEKIEDNVPSLQCLAAQAYIKKHVVLVENNTGLELDAAAPSEYAKLVTVARNQNLLPTPCFQLNIQGSYSVTPAAQECIDKKLQQLNSVLKKSNNLIQKTLIYAIQKCNNVLWTIPILIQAGADVDLFDEPNQILNPLYFAIFEQNFTGVRYLVDAGANVNCMGNNTKTPLERAACNGNLDIINYLIESNANVNQSTCSQDTPLHAATWSRASGNTILMRLLHAKANINKKDEYGKTPLYMAAQLNYREKVKTLITAGADVNEPDTYGGTPLSIATALGYQEIAALLIEAGAALDKTK